MDPILATERCSLCGLEYCQHAEYFNEDSEEINNCARRHGDKAESCQVCKGKCPGPHVFQQAPKEGKVFYQTKSVAIDKEIADWVDGIVEKHFPEVSRMHKAPREPVPLPEAWRPIQDVACHPKVSSIEYEESLRESGTKLVVSFYDGSFRGCFGPSKARAAVQFMLLNPDLFPIEEEE